MFGVGGGAQLCGPVFGVAGPGFVIVVALRGATFDAEGFGVEPGRVSRTRARDCVRLILGAAATGMLLVLRLRFGVSRRRSLGVDYGLLTLTRRGVRPTLVLGQVAGALVQLIERCPASAFATASRLFASLRACAPACCS